MFFLHPIDLYIFLVLFIGPYDSKPVCHKPIETASFQKMHTSRDTDLFSLKEPLLLPEVKVGANSESGSGAEFAAGIEYILQTDTFVV